MPFEVTDQQNYMLIRLYGAVTGAELLEAAQGMSAIEARHVAIDRVTDLNGMEELHFDYLDVDAVAQIRRSLPFKSPIRSAIVASRPLHVGYARMFQTLNDNPAIEVRIVPSMDEAFAWLKR
ncbi:MAG: hypothetical protein ACJ8MH_13965 [Povalibacter sp.]